MQEQYDRKKAELEQKLLREKAELAKVNRDFHPFTKKKQTEMLCQFAFGLPVFCLVFP